MPSTGSSPVTSTRSSTRSRPTNANANSANNEPMRTDSTWQATRTEIARRLSAAGILTADAEARFLVEGVSGYGPSDWPSIPDDTPPARAVARLGPMIERRIVGEPLQYV